MHVSEAIPTPTPQVKRRALKINREHCKYIPRVSVHKTEAQIFE